MNTRTFKLVTLAMISALYVGNAAAEELQQSDLTLATQQLELENKVEEARLAAEKKAEEERLAIEAEKLFSERFEIPPAIANA